MDFSYQSHYFENSLVESIERIVSSIENMYLLQVKNISDERMLKNKLSDHVQVYF